MEGSYTRKRIWSREKAGLSKKFLREFNYKM
jgi:hypothetical protein